MVMKTGRFIAKLESHIPAAPLLGYNFIPVESEDSCEYKIWII